MPRIVVLDTLSDEGLDLLKASPGVEFEVRTGLKGDDLRKTLAEFNAARLSGRRRRPPDRLIKATRL